MFAAVLPDAGALSRRRGERQAAGFCMGFGAILWLTGGVTITRGQVLDLCRRHGFERAGIALAGPTPHGDFLSQWLARGYQGDMQWLGRSPEFRRDIRLRFEWARSFIVLAMDYAPELPQSLPQRSALPLVARYARGVDYHEFYKPRLKALQDDLRALGAQAMWYQDTGPFLERELAAQAGLGWVGKNTLLIDPESGSWKFLALVVTSLDLEPDAPGADHCGHCTACLDACPTKAFVQPWVLDARKCVSYLTIELKGAMDPALRPGVGSWLFGCDICQEVCPWNRKAPVVRATPGAELAELTLAKILSARDEHLMKRLAGTPLERTGSARLKRNAAVAAGNLQDETLLPALEQCSRHPELFVREACYWALARYGTVAARAVLARAQRHEDDDTLREQIISALQAGPTVDQKTQSGPCG